MRGEILDRDDIVMGKQSLGQCVEVQPSRADDVPNPVVKVESIDVDDRPCHARLGNGEAARTGRLRTPPMKRRGG
jgi:hypothetical protein